MKEIKPEVKKEAYEKPRLTNEGCLKDITSAKSPD
jgi:hypothetical protein